MTLKEITKRIEHIEQAIETQRRMIDMLADRIRELTEAWQKERDNGPD